MLDDKKRNREMMEGMLPANAPLANPYVPFQRKIHHAMKLAWDWLEVLCIQDWTFRLWEWSTVGNCL